MFEMTTHWPVLERLALPHTCQTGVLRAVSTNCPSLRDLDVNLIVKQDNIEGLASKRPLLHLVRFRCTVVRCRKWPDGGRIACCHCKKLVDTVLQAMPALGYLEQSDMTSNQDHQGFTVKLNGRLRTDPARARRFRRYGPGDFLPCFPQSTVTDKIQQAIAYGT